MNLIDPQKPTCRVVHCQKDDYDVYIGRPSKWGNPFSHIQDKKTRAEFLVNSRKEAVDAYEQWILHGGGQHLLQDLKDLQGKILGCWCVPKSCHGEILVKLVNNLPNQNL
jgi:hypothetical protein